MTLSKVAQRAAHDLVRNVMNGTTWIRPALRPDVLESVAAALIAEATKLRSEAEENR